VRLDASDPPSPPAVARGFARAAAVVALGAFGYQWLTTGSGDWKLVAFAGLVLALNDVVATYLGMAGAALSRMFHGSAITLDDEIADLEMRLADPALPAEREIPAALRLAEIYRKYRHDSRRAEALVGRVRTKYPDAPELRGADLVT
jgi:hypothetical protein